MSYHTRPISTSRQHSKFRHIGAALLASMLMPTQQSYTELLESLREAVPAKGMAVVTDALCP